MLEGKISELNTQLKMKAFEHERTILTFEETSANLKQANLIIEQQRKKVEVCCINGIHYITIPSHTILSFFVMLPTTNQLTC